MTLRLIRSDGAVRFTGNIHEAYHNVNAAIVLFFLKGSNPPSLVYELKYDMLIASCYFDTGYENIYCER